MFHVTSYEPGFGAMHSERMSWSPARKPYRAEVQGPAFQLSRSRSRCNLRLVSCLGPGPSRVEVQGPKRRAVIRVESVKTAHLVRVTKTHMFRFACAGHIINAHALAQDPAVKDKGKVCLCVLIKSRSSVSCFVVHFMICLILILYYTTSYTDITAKCRNDYEPLRHSAKRSAM